MAKTNNPRPEIRIIRSFGGYLDKLQELLVKENLFSKGPIDIDYRNRNNGEWQNRKGYDFLKNVDNDSNVYPEIIASFHQKESVKDQYAIISHLESFEGADDDGFEEYLGILPTLKMIVKHTRNNGSEMKYIIQSKKPLSLAPGKFRNTALELKEITNRFEYPETMISIIRDYFKEFLPDEFSISILDNIKHGGRFIYYVNIFSGKSQLLKLNIDFSKTHTSLEIITFDRNGYRHSLRKNTSPMTKDIEKMLNCTILYLETKDISDISKCLPKEWASSRF